MVLDLDDNFCASKLFSLWFPLHFDDAVSGMPSNAKFTSCDFKRPVQHNPTSESLHLKTANTACLIQSSTPLWQLKKSDAIDMVVKSISSENTDQHSGTVLFIEVPPKTWSPKVISYFQIPSYTDIDDGVFEFEFHGKWMFRPKITGM